MGDLSSFNDDKIRPGMRRTLPAGEYAAQVADLELKSPKKEPDGIMLVTTFVVADGEHCGHRIVDHAVLRHSSVDAMILGKVKLKTLAHAVLGHDAADTAELQGKFLLLVVSVKDDAKYGTQNEVFDYKPLPPGMKLDLRAAVVPGLPGEVLSTENMPNNPPIDLMADVAPKATRGAEEQPSGAGDGELDAATLAAMTAARMRAKFRTSTQVAPPAPGPAENTPKVTSEPKTTGTKTKKVGKAKTASAAGMPGNVKAPNAPTPTPVLPGQLNFLDGEAGHDTP